MPKSPWSLLLACTLGIAACGYQDPGWMGDAAPGLASARDAGGDLLHEAFALADTDHDGSLDLAESGLSPSQFQALDSNGDGRLTPDEFFAPMTAAQAAQYEAPFASLEEAAFERLDLNHDGVVTQEELTQALGIRGDTSGQGQQYERIFHAADHAGQGRLDRQAFHEFYQRVGTGQVGDMGVVSSGLGNWVLGGYLELMGNVEAQLALHPLPRPSADGTPADLGMAFTNVSYPTSDGLTIRSWMIPAAEPTTRAVILVHGYNSNKHGWLKEPELRWLHPQYDVLAIDLRNNGDSDGTETSFDYYEDLDVLASIRWLEAQGIRSIALFGISMGGATVIRTGAVTHDPAVKCIWDDCSYATDLSAFTGFAGATHLPDPALIAAAAIPILNSRIGVDITSTQPVNVVADIAPTPLYIVHGAADPLVVPANSQLNYDAAGQPKFLWFVPGAVHGQSDVTDPTDYQQRLMGFLGNYL